MRISEGRFLDVNSEELEDRSSAIHFLHNLRVWGRFIVRGFRQRPRKCRQDALNSN